MSQHQQISIRPVPQEQNVYLRYQKISRGGKNKIRSGIIERYTYKTDNGELLNNPTKQAICNKQPAGSKTCANIITVSHKSDSLSSASSSRTSLLPANVQRKLNVAICSTPKHHIIHQKVSVPHKMGNSSKDDDSIVRTEHCDSTTDIIENVDTKSIIFESSTKHVSNKDASVEYNRFKEDFNEKKWNSKDSDSDCEIIDVKSYDTNSSHISMRHNRYPVSLDDKITLNSDKDVFSLENLSTSMETPNTKVLDWINKKPSQEFKSVINLISDESEDEYLCDKTGLKTIKEKEITVINIASSDSQLLSDGRSTDSVLLKSVSEVNIDSIVDVKPSVKVEVTSDLTCKSNQIDGSNVNITLQKQVLDLKEMQVNEPCNKQKLDSIKIGIKDFIKTQVSDPIKQVQDSIIKKIESTVDHEILPIETDESKINVTSNIQTKDPIAFINEKYHKIKTQLNHEKNSTMISIPLKLSSDFISMKSEPLETCSLSSRESPPMQNVCAIKNESDTTSSIVQKQNEQSPKINAPLSPESMKSEFYNYLKINTNPSAQKAEAVAQNRRSTRVKNIISQTERNKGLNNEKMKKDKVNDIRKKFMKYSKHKTVFPSFPTDQNTIIDFDLPIEVFFIKKRIPYKLHRSNPEEKPDGTDLDKLNLESRKSSYDESNDHTTKKYIHNQKQKLFKFKNRIMKKKRKKLQTQKIIGCTPQLSDIKLRRLRFRPNRIFRDSAVRITRHSLDGYKIINPQSKTKKVKLKTKIKLNKLKSTEINSKKNEETTLQLTSTEPKLRITEIQSHISDMKRRLIEIDAMDAKKVKVIKNKMILTKATEPTFDFKPKIIEPKVTIKEINSSIQTNLESTKALKPPENKITITEIKPTIKSIDTTEDSSSPSELDFIYVGSSNSLLPNILAQKLSIALQQNFSSAIPTKHKTSATLPINSVKKDYINKTSASKSLPSTSSDEDNVENKELSSSESNEELDFFTGFPQSKNKIFETKRESIQARSNTASPECFGFKIDEKSIKICKTMQEVVSNLDTDILVPSSPIQTPEPIENLAPEIRINSIPITSEPCNLQEVISIVSDLNSSKEINNLRFQDDESSSDYSETSSSQEEIQIETALGDLLDPSLIEKNNSPHIIPLNQNIKAKSFHRSLMQTKVIQKSVLDSNRSSLFEQSDSDSSMSMLKVTSSKKSLTHGIDIDVKGGAIFTTYYVNGILIIVQEFMITFWKQTALGNILGAQNMWLPYGNLQRIILERGCVNLRSFEMVLSCDNSIAYIELWTKQHESKFRECPLADVFATIYYHRGHGLPDKKVLQLENIKGYGHDVRFVVIKSSREIIVSWCDTLAEPVKTLVRSYQLATDFQTICSVKEMECVHHGLLSMHNIQDCDDLVLGAGSEQISVWNLRHGYLVTTLNLADSTNKSQLESKTLLLYAQCDTGFLFLIQQIEVGVLRLVAVNGMTQEWKQLQSYQVPTNYKELLGIIVESGVLMTCYTNGFLCWNINTGQILAEIEMVDNIVLPTNKYLVAFKNYQVKVQHIMSYILTHDW